MLGLNLKGKGVSRAVGSGEIAGRRCRGNRPTKKGRRGPADELDRLLL